DIFLGNIYLSGLAAGTQTGGTVGPNVLPNPGTWYVGMIIDSHDDVFESNETNNTAWDDITWLPAGPELDVEIRIVDSVYASDNMSDAEFASYTSIADVPVGATYYAEVWLRDTGSIMSGITGGQVDITYTTASADAGALDHGGVYTLLPSGAVDDPNGLIDDFGGATLNVGEGVTEWVRLGWADIAGTNVGDATFALLPGAANFAQVGAGNIDWSQINFTGTPVTVQQLPAGVDVDVWLVPRIAPSAANTSPTPPDSDRDPFWQRETCDYYVEVWIQSDQGNPAAISGGSVDVLFDPQYTEAISVDHGTIFTILPIENIDNVNGIVSIGGGTMATDMGDDEFVLLGRILFHGDAPVDEVAHQAGPYDTNLNVTNGPADFALVGTGNVDADFQAVPTVDIRANIYDIDDNGQVDFSDFSYFVPAFLHNVGDPEPPYVWWADFDESGQVNFGDFSYFATAFMKPFCDAGIVFPTGRFESTRLADLPESPLAIALSPAQASGAEAASVGAVQLPAAATRNFPALLEPEITRATPVNPAVMYTPNRLARQAGGDAWGTDAPVGAVIVPVLGMGDWMASLPNPKFQKEMEKTLPVQPVIGVSRLVIEKKSVRIGQPVAVPVLDVLQDIAALDTDL
ncbi:MAG: hypothetical protein KAV00_00715, partial [Phycisphaerae bacterium]|nr:hypothetical protein [Phycisphaerae bacterium]